MHGQRLPVSPVCHPDGSKDLPQAIRVPTTPHIPALESLLQHPVTHTNINFYVRRELGSNGEGPTVYCEQTLTFKDVMTLLVQGYAG